MENICQECTAKDECDKNPTWTDGCAGFTNMPLNDPLARAVVELRLLKDFEDSQIFAERYLKKIAPRIIVMEKLSDKINQIEHFFSGVHDLQPLNDSLKANIAEKEKLINGLIVENEQLYQVIKHQREELGRALAAYKTVCRVAAENGIDIPGGEL